MHVRVWIATGIRVLAIYLVFEAAVSSFSAMTTARSLGLENTGVYVVNLLSLFLAAILWFFPMSIAGKIVPITMEESESRYTAIDLAKVGCGLLAIYLIVDNLWSITLAFYFLDSGYQQNSDAIVNLSSGILSLVSGFILLFNTRKVAVYLSRLA